MSSLFIAIEAPNGIGTSTTAPPLADRLTETKPVVAAILDLLSRPGHPS